MHFNSVVGKWGVKITNDIVNDNPLQQPDDDNNDCRPSVGRLFLFTKVILLTIPMCVEFNNECIVTIVENDNLFPRWSPPEVHFCSHRTAIICNYRTKNYIRNYLLLLLHFYDDLLYNKPFFIVGGSLKIKIARNMHLLQVMRITLMSHCVAWRCDF